MPDYKKLYIQLIHDNMNTIEELAEIMKEMEERSTTEAKVIIPQAPDSFWRKLHCTIKQKQHQKSTAKPSCRHRNGTGIE